MTDVASLVEDAEPLDRDSAFSYRCRGCGRCCVHKRIQVNPYEILRLARNRGLSTGKFCRRYLEQDGPWLRTTEEGACVFLRDGGCSVHPDRPLACRTYPLGRWRSADAEETFRRLRSHPRSEGVFGRDGTVQRFLDEQGVAPYAEAADRYQALFYRLFDALHRILPRRPDLPDATPRALLASDESDAPAFLEWLDVDAIVSRACADRGREVPGQIEAVVCLHIAAIDQWLEDSNPGEDES